MEPLPVLLAAFPLIVSLLAALGKQYDIAEYMILLATFYVIFCIETRIEQFMNKK